MSKRSLLILLIFVLFLAACNGDSVEETPPPRPTPTTEVAAPTAEGEAYPAQPQSTAPAAAYPAPGDGSEALTENWVVLPAGEQCAESLAYPSPESAVAGLEEAGVTPLAVEEIELLVCEACGCPTSAHYRVLVSAEDLSAAITLGWQPEG